MFDTRPMSTSDAAAAFSTLADLQRGMAARSGGSGPSVALPLAAAQLPLKVERTRTFDTPEFAGMTFLEVESKSALNRVHGMPFKWSINPYRGCSHACQYCFARPTHTYLNLNAFEEFEKVVVVKTNVADVLRHELSKKSWTGEHVAMGTNTDPYQRCEGRYRLMPDIIAALGESLTPFSILTKGTLITRDLDVLTAAARRVDVRATLTIGMLDERLWRSSEPGTPSPRARLDAVRALNDAGIPTGVMLAPIMPGLNDQPEQLAALVDAAADAGATHINPIVLHLRPGVREVFWPWLEREHPELVARYTAMYQRSNAEKSYREAVEQHVRTRRRIAFRLHGRGETPEYFRSREPAGAQRDAEEAGDQLTLL